MATPPSPPGPPAPWPRRGPWILFGGLVVAAVAIVVAIPLLVPTVGFGIAVHEVCGTGGEVESEVFWTPLVLVNSPYGGQAWGNGSGTGVQPDNGQAIAEVETFTWHLFRLVNTSAAGPGLSAPCTSGFAATYAPTGDLSPVDLIPSGATTDMNEPRSFTLSGTPSVIFDPTPFTADSGGVQIDNCESLTTAEETASSSVYPITVPFTGSGTSHDVRVLFPAPASYAYHFPLGGMWAADFAAQDAQGQYEGGWSFTWHSCTTVPPPA